jgi:hypothetical protein
LGSHNMLDFREASKRTASLTPLIFPGITRKRLDVWLVNWRPNTGWNFLRERLVAQHGVSEIRDDDILRDWNKGAIGGGAGPPRPACADQRVRPDFSSQRPRGAATGIERGAAAGFESNHALAGPPICDGICRDTRHCRRCRCSLFRPTI